MEVAAGVKEDGIVVGNTYDKYGAKNPIVRKIMRGFEDSLSSCVKRANPSSIHEVGCGEGYWVLRWQEQGIEARGTDFSNQVISMAQQNAAEHGLSETIFSARSVYDLDPAIDSADLVVCCEVLEHLEDPAAALKALQTVTQRHLIVSVPREPLWRVLNVARGKYIGACGNTPGHLQHWSKNGIAQLVSQYFDIVEMKSPLPWTMMLCRSRN